MNKITKQEADLQETKFTGEKQIPRYFSVLIAIILLLGIIVIKNLDMNSLRKQKEILISMIMDQGEADDPNQREDAKEVEGIINLIDAIQDHAVDVLGMSEKEVFNFKK